VFPSVRRPTYHVKTRSDICNHPYTTMVTFLGESGKYTYHRMVGCFDDGVPPNTAVHIRASMTRKGGVRKQRRDVVPKV